MCYLKKSTDCGGFLKSGEEIVNEFFPNKFALYLGSIRTVQTFNFFA